MLVLTDMLQTADGIQAGYFLVVKTPSLRLLLLMIGS